MIGTSSVLGQWPWIKFLKYDVRKEHVYFKFFIISFIKLMLKVDLPHTANQDGWSIVMVVLISFNININWQLVTKYLFVNVWTVVLRKCLEELTLDTSSLLSFHEAERSHSRTHVCRESEEPKKGALSCDTWSKLASYWFQISKYRIAYHPSIEMDGKTTFVTKVYWHFITFTDQV